MEGLKVFQPQLDTYVSALRREMAEHSDLSAGDYLHGIYQQNSTVVNQQNVARRRVPAASNLLGSLREKQVQIWGLCQLGEE